MTPTWADRVSPDRSGDLRSLYTEIPDLTDATLRHLRLLRLGPAVSLRLDLPRFPDHAPSEWSGSRWLQCHLLFLDVADVALTGTTLPAVVTFAFEDLPLSRVGVTVTGDLTLSFTAAATLRLGRLSAHGGDRRHYLGRLERARFTDVPGPEAESYHDRF